MNISYTIRQYEAAGRDCEEVYNLADRRIKGGCLPVSREALANAFQVFRYAFQEWARGKEEGVVLRALMYRDKRTREVKPHYQKEEVEIYCDDEETAEAIERLLKKDGYEENS